MKLTSKAPARELQQEMKRKEKHRIHFECHTQELPRRLAPNECNELYELDGIRC